MALHYSGVLLWPEQSLVVVADLHLEKASHFATRGQFLPPFDSAETLSKLMSLLETFSVKKLMLLGDSFHDADGYHRMTSEAQELFDKMCARYELIWVAGNHDGDFVPSHLERVEALTLNSITFRHQAQIPADYEISGHFHPKVFMRYKRERLSKPCFVENGKRMILPAFGTFTGGLDIRDDVFRSMFENGIQNNTDREDLGNIHMLGQEAIYTAPYERFL